MRPASIGPVKAVLRQVNLQEAREVVTTGMAQGVESVRPMVMGWLATQAD